MITDHAAYDGAAEQQPIIASERTAGRLCVLLGLVSDDLGSAAAKINDLQPVKISGRQLSTAKPQFIGTVDAKWLVPLVSSYLMRRTGDRLRQLSVVLGEHRDIRQGGRRFGRARFLHDQPLTNSAERCRLLDSCDAASRMLRINGEVSNRRCRGRPSERWAADCRS
jgi:hypothetical protein